MSVFANDWKFMHTFTYYYRLMANRRLQSLLEANKWGLTLHYDPPASINLCFYRCLSKFVDVKEEDIVQMVQRHLFYMHACSRETRTLVTKSGKGKGETGEGTVEGRKSVGKEFLETRLIEGCPRWHEKLRRRSTANQERTNGKPSCLYSVWKTN